MIEQRLEIKNMFSCISVARIIHYDQGKKHRAGMVLEQHSESSRMEPMEAERINWKCQGL